jgi:hypothetical protein
MNKVTVKIQTLEDAGEDRRNPAMPELKGKKVENSKDITVCVMEDMTAKNKAGVSIVLELEDGSFASHFLTEGAMDMMIQGYEGAKSRFADLKANR